MCENLKLMKNNYTIWGVYKSNKVNKRWITIDKEKVLIENKSQFKEQHEISKQITPFSKEAYDKLINTSYNELDPQFRKLSNGLASGEYILLKCGKCKSCKAVKAFKLANLVDRVYQNPEYKYSYFITLTFSNKKILFIDSKDNIDAYRELESKELLSSIIGNRTSLSKNDWIKVRTNIIKKIKNYYNKDVKIHYSYCGEYGSKYGRAHYHMILLMNKPIPELKLEYTGYQNGHKTITYKSKYFESKQYDKYEIRQMIGNDASATAKYLVKYMNKDGKEDKRFFSNLNRYQDKKSKTA